MYQITHTYLTMDDDNQPIVETETKTVDGPEDIADTVRLFTRNPGERSGTTVSLTVTLTESVSI